MGLQVWPISRCVALDYPLPEENAVAFVSDLGRDGRLPFVIAGEVEAVGIVARPVNRGVGIQEQPGDMEILVVNVAAILDSVPAYRVRNRRADRGAVVQRIGNIEEVAHVLPGDAQGCCACVQIDVDGVGRDPHGPEQPGGIGVDAGVEVVNLCREVGKVKLTFVEIQSDKTKGAVVDATVHADIRALHEPHIHIEQQVVCPVTLDLGGAYEAVEVINRRRLFTAGRKDVERRPWD